MGRHLALFCLLSSPAWADCTSEHYGDVSALHLIEASDQFFDICYDARYGADVELARPWLRKALTLGLTRDDAYVGGAVIMLFLADTYGEEMHGFRPPATSRDTFARAVPVAHGVGVAFNCGRRATHRQALPCTHIIRSGQLQHAPVFQCGSRWLRWTFVRNRAT